MKSRTRVECYKRRMHANYEKELLLSAMDICGVVFLPFYWFCPSRCESLYLDMFAGLITGSRNPYGQGIP